MYWRKIHYFTFAVFIFIVFMCTHLKKIKEGIAFSYYFNFTHFVEISLNVKRYKWKRLQSRLKERSRKFHFRWNQNQISGGGGGGLPPRRALIVPHLAKRRVGKETNGEFYARRTLTRLTCTPLDVSRRTHRLAAGLTVWILCAEHKMADPASRTFIPEVHLLSCRRGRNDISTWFAIATHLLCVGSSAVLHQTSDLGPRGPSARGPGCWA